MPSLPWLAGWILTMLTVVISFVYFRAGDMTEAHTILSAMFSPQNIVLPNWLAGLATQFDIPWRTLDFFASGSYTVRLTGWIALLFLLSLLPQNPAANPSGIRPSFVTACLTAGMLLISLWLARSSASFHLFPVLGAFDVMATLLPFKLPLSVRFSYAIGLGGSTCTRPTLDHAAATSSLDRLVASLPFETRDADQIVLFGDSVTQDVANQYELAEEGRLADLTPAHQG